MTGTSRRRHGVSRLPQGGWRQTRKEALQALPIGYFHLDIAELRTTAEGKRHLFIAIDRTSKFALTRLVQRANVQSASAFLNDLVAAVPYGVHTVPTDHGIQFADLARNRNGPTARLRGQPFERACWRHGIAHRLTKPKHPWPHGQAERMNRTIKEATVKRFHDDSQGRLRSHLDAFVCRLQLGAAPEDPPGSNDSKSTQRIKFRD